MFWTDSAVFDREFRYILHFFQDQYNPWEFRDNPVKGSQNFSIKFTKGSLP